MAADRRTDGRTDRAKTVCLPKSLIVFYTYTLHLRCYLNFQCSPTVSTGVNTVNAILLYLSTQGGIIAMTKGLAIGEAKNGVRINTYVCMVFILLLLILLLLILLQWLLLSCPMYIVLNISLQSTIVLMIYSDVDFY